MAEPRTVWVLTAGEYDDYRVVSLFDSRAAVDAYLAAIPAPVRAYKEFNEPEEWPLNPPAPAVARGDMMPYEVWMLVDGRTEFPRCADSQPVRHVRMAPWAWIRAAEGNSGPDRIGWQWSQGFDGRHPCGAFCSHVWARDEAHAVELADGLRRAWLAEKGTPDGSEVPNG